MNLQDLDEAMTGQPLTVADLVAALLVLAVGIFLSMLLGRALRRYLGRPGRQSEQTAKLLGRVFQWSIVAVAVAWALGILGLDIGMLSLVLAIILLIAALALRPLVESFAASVVISSRPAFGVGDEIVIEDTVGAVIEITQRSVVVRQRDGRRVHIPNADALSNKVTVLTTDSDRRSTLRLQLASETDIANAVRVITTAIEDLPEIKRPGAVRASSLENGLQMSVGFWHASNLEAEKVAVDAVIRALQPALLRENIQSAPSLEVRILPEPPG